VLALGLGQLEILSKLSQPLQARIPLLLSPDERLSEIQVQLASEIEFAKQRIPRFTYLNNLQFKVVEINQLSFIQITSLQAVMEPALHFLLQIDIPTGKLINAYTILLDPSEDNQSDPEKVINYGPVLQNESLWSIADKLRPSQDVTLSQVVAAIFLKNPQAFSHGNLNGLKVGKELQVPTLVEIKAIPQEQALVVIKEHHRAWNDKIKEPQQITNIIPRVNNSIQPISSPDANNDIINLPTDKGVLTDSEKLNSIEMAGAVPDISVQQELLDTKQTLAKAQQANTELKQSYVQLATDMQGLTQKYASLTNELQAKTAELIEIKVKAAELTNKATGLNKHTPSNWLKKLFIGLIMLAGLGALIIYVKKNQGFKRVEFNFFKQFQGPDFLAKLKTWFTAKRVRAPEIHEMPETQEAVVELTEQETHNFERPVELKPQVNTEAPTIDPLEEAGIYFVYGRYEQAQKVLLAALEQRPDRLDLKQKLLEVYAAKGDRVTFEQFANQIRTSLAGENPEFWQQIQELHRKSWPAQYEKNAQDDSHRAEAEEQPASHTEEAETTVMQVPEVIIEAIEPSVDLEKFAQEPPNAASTTAEILLADEDVVATKLEMARSCIEIGAIPDARKLLLEVQKLGDEAQRKEAERLLLRLS
jgi:pilus assembly protein FimV